MRDPLFRRPARWPDDRRATDNPKSLRSIIPVGPTPSNQESYVTAMCGARCTVSGNDRPAPLPPSAAEPPVPFFGLGACARLSGQEWGFGSCHLSGLRLFHVWSL